MRYPLAWFPLQGCLKKAEAACVRIAHTLHRGIGGFIRATACYSLNNVSLNNLSRDSYNISISDES